MPMAEYERDQLEDIEAADLKRLAALTDELGQRRVEVEAAAADRRYALGDEQARRVRALNWNPRAGAREAIQDRFRRYTR